uniref:Uncharacterized protein n=1 Tax=Meloidogyne javanica TaxID=6303 RepID=A0A915N5K8_MELJA
MNMAKLRQILEFRRATKMPPLLPPKRSKKQDEGKRNNQREILDIHLKLREFIGTRKTENGGSSITTASELLNSGVGKKYFELPNVFAIEFQLERQQYLRLDICDLLETQNEAKSFGYCVFSVSELVCARNGKIQRKLINDETGQEIAEVIFTFYLLKYLYRE